MSMCRSLIRYWWTFFGYLWTRGNKQWFILINRIQVTKMHMGFQGWDRGWTKYDCKAKRTSKGWIGVFIVQERSLIRCEHAFVGSVGNAWYFDLNGVFVCVCVRLRLSHFLLGSYESRLLSCACVLLAWGRFIGSEH